MIRKQHPDYVMKRIEELAKVLATLLGFKGDDKPEAIIQTSEEALDELFEGNLPWQKPIADLLTWIEEEGLSKDDLINLSDIFFERSEAIARKEGEEHAQAAYRQTLASMEYTLEKEKVFPFHWASRTEYIKSKLTAQ